MRLRISQHRANILFFEISAWNDMGTVVFLQGNKYFLTSYDLLQVNQL